VDAVEDLQHPRVQGVLREPEGGGDRVARVIQRGATYDDPYVRKAAALAILNFHLTRPSYIDRFKLGPVLKGLVEDSNLNVAALTEINMGRADPLFAPSGTTANNLLAAIDTATEWSQIQILDFVATYKPEDSGEARGIIARTVPRLSHANPTVVFAAVRCCLQMNTFVDDHLKVRDTVTKVVLPLVTQLNNSAPVQYTAVKSILILLQKYRRMLASEVSIFFCKFDDPLYMKLAKLDAILTLASNQNVGKVLEELYDSAQQTDVEFVRKSIRAIGKVSVAFEAAADAWVDTKGQYVVEECTVIGVDIFGRYPGKYEGIIAKINSRLTGTLDDHQAKAALAWILGEYSDSLSDPSAVFNALFLDESEDVQLGILTATVKFYFNSEDGDDLLRRVISLATNQVDNPDVRDRAFQYFALVQGGGDRASGIVLPELTSLPPLTVDLTAINPALIDDLVPLVGTLCALYEKRPNDFVESTQFLSLEELDVPDEMNQSLQAAPPRSTQCGSQSLSMLRTGTAAKSAGLSSASGIRAPLCFDSAISGRSHSQ
jgi:vesicle coat complex subunit